MAQIPGSARVNQYVAIAGQTVFIYDYKVYQDDEIKVQSGGTTLTLTTDYTVQDAGVDSGGTITLVVGALVDTIITLTGDSMIERDTTFTNGGDYLASAINGEYDKLDNITKEIVTNQTGNFRLAVYNDAVSKTVPLPTSRRALVWNTAGTALENSDYDPDLAQGDAAASAAAALVSENNAADSAAAALVSEDNAADSATAASDSADDAAASAASIDLGNLASDIIPDTTGVRSLGSASKTYAEAHVDDLMTGSVETVSMTLAGTNVFIPLRAEYSHSVAYNVDGGTSTALTWVTRTLNTEIMDDIGITRSSNQLTLPAGTYTYHTICQCHDLDKIQTRIRQVSGTPATMGLSCMTNQGGGDVNTLTDFGTFTIAASQTIELQSFGSNGKASDGLGLSHDIVAFGNNIYVKILLERTA